MPPGHDHSRLTLKKGDPPSWESQAAGPEFERPDGHRIENRPERPVTTSCQALPLIRAAH
jgi:hypothetical protein